MDDERDKFDRPADEGDDVEGHKFSPDESNEKFADSADDEDGEVEAHKF
jgi:hypothetical protein